MIDKQYYLLNSTDRCIYMRAFERIENRKNIVFVNGFASERNYSYIPIRKWGEFLVENGFNFYSFDYYGTGESSGDFENATLNKWVQDLNIVINEVNRRNVKSSEIVLHGFRMGCMISNMIDGNYKKIFWAPILSSEVLFKDLFRMKMVTDMTIHNDEKRMTAQDILEKIKKGNIVQIEGYNISKSLYDSFQNGDEDLKLGKGELINVAFTKKFLIDENNCCEQVVIEVPRPFFWSRSPYVNPDLQELYKVTSDLLKNNWL